MIEKLTAEEIKTITTYRKRYGDIKEARYDTNFLPTEDWLKEWEIGKSENLENLFGGALYVEFPVEFTQSNDYLCKEFDKKLDSHPFYDALCHWVWNLDDTATRRNLSCITEDRTIIKKVYPRDCKVELPYFDEKAGKERKLVITKGMKLTTIYSKLNKYFKLVSPETYEDFRQKYSTLFNSEKVKGTYVLSMRPLDYMTMSDNDYNWSSCMSWQSQGCYRRGTIEMMNSPYVIVGYLKGDKPLSSYTFATEIDNKKWRSLFVVHPEIITSIKSYPYYSGDLMEIGIKKLKECAEKNLGYSYDDEPKVAEENNFEFFDGFSEDLKERIHYCYEFETTFMYNDFGTGGTKHHYFLAKDEDRKIFESFVKSGYHYDTKWINYSGRFICTNCGTTEDYDDYSDAEGLPLLCDSCYGYCECAVCGRRISSNEESYETIDYDCVCSRCIEEEYVWVDYREAYVRYEDVSRLNLAIKTGKNTYKLSTLDVQVCEDDLGTFEDVLPDDAGYRIWNSIIEDCGRGENDFLVLDPEKVVEHWSYFKRYLMEAYGSLDEFFARFFFTYIDKEAA
jgi:hypothetical protein